MDIGVFRFLGRLLLWLTCLMGVQWVSAQLNADSLEQVLPTLPRDTTRIDALLKLSGHYFFSNPGKTETLAREAVRLADSLNHPKMKGEAYRNLGISQAIRFRFQESLVYYDSALVAFGIAAYAKGEASVYYSMGAAKTELGEREEAMVYYEKALKIQKDQGEWVGLANTYVGIGNLLAKTSSNPERLLYMDSAEIYYERAGERKLMAILENNRCAYYFGIHNYPKALEHAFKALSINEELGQETSMSSNYFNLANIYSQLDEHSKAVDYYQKCKEIRLRQGNLRGAATATSNMAAILSKEQRNEEALQAFREVKTIYEQTGAKCIWPFSVMNMGDLHYRLGQRDSAFYYLELARERSEECEEMRVLEAVSSILANIYLKEGDTARAERHFLEVIRYASESGDYLYPVEAYKALSDLARKRGQYRHALLYMDEHLKRKDSTYNEENNRKIARLEAQYQFNAEKDSIAVVHQQELLEREAETERQQLLKRGSMMLAGVLVVVLLIIVFFLRKISRKNAMLAQLSQELLQKNELIAIQNEELHELNNVKTRIFSIISHDLRSPLATLVSSLNLYKDGDLDDREFHLFAKTLEKEITVTSAFLDTLLQWARSQMEGIEPNFRELDVRLLLAETASLVEPQVRFKHIEVELEPGEPVTMWADLDMMRLVVRNLLTNAIKFSFEGGKIALQAGQEGDEVWFSVRDHGLGMDAGRLANLFTIQSNSTVGTMNEKGIGLGLILCKDFVERNHGRITVESQPGEGTTFKVSGKLKIEN